MAKQKETKKHFVNCVQNGSTGFKFLSTCEGLHFKLLRCKLFRTQSVAKLFMVYWIWFI